MDYQGIKTALLLSVASGVGVFPSSAFAQQAEMSENPGDIIVTARRVEERLQDVPISITAFSQNQITERNIVTATDLGSYTPSLSVRQQFGPEKAAFSLRGFNADLSTSPTVGVYFADVVGVRAENGTVSGSGVGPGSFMDLQNVQVLKGPQGTLFGRNTTGGAILLVPNKPTDRLEGWVEGQIGDYNLRRVQAVLNVPLADTFKIRAAVDRNKRDGYMKNQIDIGPRDYNDVDYFAARLSILAELTPTLENTTIFHYSNSDTNGYATRTVACERDPAKRTGLQALTAPASCAQIDRQAARGDGPFDVEANLPSSYIQIRQWQIINTTNWQVSDTLTVKNILSYGEYAERADYNVASENFVFGGQPLNLIMLGQTPGGYASRQSAITEELQLQGNSADGKLNWVAGGYLEFNRPINFAENTSTFFLNCDTPSDVTTCTNPFGFGSFTKNAYNNRFDNHGVFAQGTYQISDQFSVTAGARYTFDKATSLNQRTRIDGLGTPNEREICAATLYFNQGKDANGNLIPIIPTNRAQCESGFTEKSSKPTWVIDLDYKPNSDILLYAKYARGYRQGGVASQNVGVEVWKPESIDAYELGAKTTLRGAVTGYFNVAAFYNNLTDQQVFASFIPKPGNVNAAGPINAGKSRVWGIEVDASLSPFEGFRVDFGYTYLNTRIKSLDIPALDPDAPFSAIVPRAAAGDAATYSPKHKLSISPSYTLPLSEDVGKVTVGATFVYTDKQVAAIAETFPSDPAVPIRLDQVGILPATELLNINVSWEKVLGSDFDAGFFMENVTNKVYPVYPTTLYAPFGAEGVLLGKPRMYGFRLRYNFGS